MRRSAEAHISIRCRSFRWSLQQKLFSQNDSTGEQSYGATVLMDKNNTLVTTVTGPNVSTAYVFKTFGNGWCTSHAPRS